MSIALILDNQKFQVDQKFFNLSELVKDIKEQMGVDEVPLDKDSITKDTLTKIIQYCQSINYTPQKIKTPIKNRLDKVVSQADYNFIKDYDFKSEKLVELYNAAYYLQMQCLIDLITAKVGVEFYFGEKQSDYNEKLKKFNLTQDITVDLENEYKQEEQWLEDF